MKFNFKASNLSITLERPYALASEPALQLEIKDYEVKGDWRELIRGFADLIETLEPVLAAAQTEGLTPADVKFFNDFDNLGNPKPNN